MRQTQVLLGMKVKLEDDVVLTVYKPKRYQDPTGVVEHQSKIDQEHDEHSERDGVFFAMFEQPLELGVID
jgi:hypothetical protein